MDDSTIILFFLGTIFLTYGLYNLELAKLYKDTPARKRMRERGPQRSGNIYYKDKEGNLAVSPTSKPALDSYI